MAGLQAQYAPAMYVGLWTRMAALDRAHLTGLLEQRAVVQGTLLRSTIHLVSRADYWPFALAIRSARRQWYLRVSRGVDVNELDAAADRVRGALADGPLRRAELDALVDPQLRNGIGLWIDLVRVPPSGTWERRRADLYGLAEDWIGLPTVDPERGLDVLVRRYLGGFGPATRQEIATWAGLPAGTVTPVLDRLRLRRFEAEDGAELLDLPGAPLPDPGTPAPVRYLPVWDATLLVHARRTGILPEEYRPAIFTSKNPQSLNTFLVDGSVAGAWWYDKGAIRREEFHPLDAATRRELDAEADRLVELYG